MSKQLGRIVLALFAIFVGALVASNLGVRFPSWHQKSSSVAAPVYTAEEIAEIIKTKGIVVENDSERIEFSKEYRNGDHVYFSVYYDGILRGEMSFSKIGSLFAFDNSVLHVFLNTKHEIDFVNSGLGSTEDITNKLTADQRATLEKEWKAYYQDMKLDVLIPYYLAHKPQVPPAPSFPTAPLTPDILKPAIP